MKLYRNIRNDLQADSFIKLEGDDFVMTGIKIATLKRYGGALVTSVHVIRRQSNTGTNTTTETYLSSQSLFDISQKISSTRNNVLAQHSEALKSYPELIERAKIVLANKLLEIPT
tara:strand:- start:387 stop:731 length:345 start_codon:yes stop_codon:yes gene_type:complete